MQPLSCSAELGDLLGRVLCVDVSQRLSVAQIAQHPWVVQNAPAPLPQAADVPASPRPPKDWATFWPAPPAQPDFFDALPGSSWSSSGGGGSAGALRLDEDEQDGAPDDLSDLAHTPLSCDFDSSNTASMGQSTDG